MRQTWPRPPTLPEDQALHSWYLLSAPYRLYTRKYRHCARFKLLMLTRSSNSRMLTFIVHLLRARHCLVWFFSFFPLHNGLTLPNNSEVYTNITLVHYTASLLLRDSSNEAVELGSEQWVAWMMKTAGLKSPFMTFYAHCLDTWKQHCHRHKDMEKSKRGQWVTQAGQTLPLAKGQQTASKHI